MSRNLKQLHEQFIATATRPMTFGNLPVEPQEAEVPVVAVERWRSLDGCMFKTYKFRRPSDKLDFVMGLLSYEQEVGHHARMTIEEDTVSLMLTTKNVDRITELDKEFAKFADTHFHDVVYSPAYADQTTGPTGDSLEDL